MDIPTFYPGETLSSEKLNRLADAIRELAAECRANRITDVANGTFERSSAGTTLAFPPQQKKHVARQGDEYVPPFAVSVAEDGSVTVAPGTTVSLVADTDAYVTTAQLGWKLQTFPPGSAKEGGGVIMTNTFDGGMDIVDDIRDAPPTAVIIATFISDTTQPGGIRVQQLIRSDITFVTHYAKIDTAGSE